MIPSAAEGKDRIISNRSRYETMNRTYRSRSRQSATAAAVVATSLIVAFGSRLMAENILRQEPAAGSSNALRSQPMAGGEAVRQEEAAQNAGAANFAVPVAASPNPVVAGAIAQKSPPAGEGLLQAMGPTDQCVERRPITEVNTDILVQGGSNERPEDVGAVCHPSQAQPAYTMAPREWTGIRYCWEAPAQCYGPLYFEETNLERYGYSQTCLRTVQPLVSSAHFFGTIPLMPYLMLAEPSRECVYTLGQYRPGSCVPFQRNYPYFSPCATLQKDNR